MDSTPSTSSSEIKQLQIKLKTTQETYAVPDSTLSVPENVDPEKLNKLIKSLLNNEETIPEFDFFLSDDLLRTTLGEFIKGMMSNFLTVIFSDGLFGYPEIEFRLCIRNYSEKWRFKANLNKDFLLLLLKTCGKMKKYLV